ncbi:MAG TPA: hypothetical protein VF711_11755, partial [Acidimicrobiales bacterium]
TPSRSKVNVVPEDLGARVASLTPRLAHVVRIVRRPGPPRLTEAPASEAAAWLLRYSFNHYKRPEESFRIVTEMAKGVRAWHLHYEQAPGGARHLLDRLCG